MLWPALPTGFGAAAAIKSTAILPSAFAALWLIEQP